MSEIRFSARRARVAGVLALLLLGMASSAYAVSATLSVTPSPVVTRRRADLYGPGGVSESGPRVGLSGRHDVDDRAPDGEISDARTDRNGDVLEDLYRFRFREKNGSTLCFVVAAGGGNVDIK